MTNNIKDKIYDKSKSAVSITLDNELLKRLEIYKKKKNILKLSPMLNEMLWEWIKKEEK